MTPRELSEELRNDSNPDLQRRRWIVGLSLVGTAMAQIVSLYQVGIVRRLPDPPLEIFDSTKVDASDYAYKRLQTPDAFMMLASYAVTAWLAGAGGKNRATQTPLLPVALGLKTVLDTATAVELGREEWQENKALCAYCQVATICSVVSVALAAPEALRAAKKLFSSRSK
jgi:uncharacterized membrane protein